MKSRSTRFIVAIAGLFVLATLVTSCKSRCNCPTFSAKPAAHAHQG